MSEENNNNYVPDSYYESNRSETDVLNSIERKKKIDEINAQNENIKQRQYFARMEEKRIQYELDQLRFNNPNSLFQRVKDRTPELQ